ncbi:hypothetical protein L7F22_026409 [Adiantum nelumboides]|nr:hypothetical protein [Adiantum nelumboides]
MASPMAIINNFPYKWHFIKVPASWWGRDWAEQEFGKKTYKKKHFIGKIVEYDAHKKVWRARFEGEDELYDFNESSLKRFLINQDDGKNRDMHDSDAIKVCDVPLEKSTCEQSGIFVNGRRRVRVEEDLASIVFEDTLQLAQNTCVKVDALIKGKEIASLFEINVDDIEVASLNIPPENNNDKMLGALHMLANQCLSPIPLEKGDGNECVVSRKRGRPKKAKLIEDAFSNGFEDNSDLEFVEVDDNMVEHESNEIRVHKNVDPFQVLEWMGEEGKEIEPPNTFFPFPECPMDSKPLIPSQKRLNAFQLFTSLFPLEVVDSIISETNRYANDVRRAAREKYPTMRRWEGIDRQSFFKFLGLVLAMTIQALPNTEAYWRGDVRGALQYPNFGRKMSLNRFQQIKRFLHLRDNKFRPLDKKTREYRCWQFLELENVLNRTFKECYQVGREVTIDERIIPTRNKRNPIRMYLPMKPHKFGIEVYNLCDSKTAYNYQFFVYDKLPQKEGLGFSMVKKLMNSLPDKGHHLYMDRGFTSFRLLQWLTFNGFGGTGTMVVSKNTKTWPKEYAWLESGAMRGSSKFAYCQKNGLFACCWQDAKPVFVASNVWGMGNVTCKRQVGRDKQTLACPEAISKYNSFKAGCDIFDQMCLGSSYSVEENMQCWKWWHKAFWGLLDAVYTNAYIIFKHWHKDISHHDFLVELQTLLVENVFSQEHLSQTMYAAIDAFSMYGGRHVLVKVAGPSNKHCKLCREQCKHDEDNAPKKWHTKRTKWKCEACNIHLCPDKCFAEYHRNMPYQA